MNIVILRKYVFVLYLMINFKILKRILFCCGWLLLLVWKIILVVEELGKFYYVECICILNMFGVGMK